MNVRPAWVGIDASCDSLSVCIMDAGGTVIDQRDNLPSDPLKLTGYLHELGTSGFVVGIESGSGTHLTRALRTAGFEVRVLDARRLSGFIKLRQNKTDRNDARGIADAMRLAQAAVPQVVLKSVSCQRLRSELVLRRRMINNRVALENAIRGTLRLNGGRVGRVFSGTHLERLICSEVDRLKSDGNDLTDVLLPASKVAAHLRSTLEVGDRRLRKIAEQHEVCGRLMTIPGVGFVCALSFYTAVEDPARFVSNEDVGPYLGLVPRVHQSGQTSRYGRITRMGSMMTRADLVGSAKSFMQQKVDSTLLRWTMRLAERAGRSKARVALARKLAVMMLAMWKSGEVFQPSVGTHL
jgi:transposase